MALPRMKNAPSTAAPGQPAPSRIATPTMVAARAPETVRALAAHPPAESSRATASATSRSGFMGPMSPEATARRNTPREGRWPSITL